MTGQEMQAKLWNETIEQMKTITTIPSWALPNREQ
jgi:hypothetical protein